MNQPFPHDYQIKAFIKNASLNEDVMKTLYDLVADGKDHAEIDDFKMFIHHFIIDCQIQFLQNNEDEKVYVRTNMMRTQIKYEEFKQFLLAMLQTEIKKQ